VLDQLILVQISELKMPLITWVISIDTIKATKSNSSSAYRILAPPIVPDVNFRAQNALSHAAHLIWSAQIKALQPLLFLQNKHWFDLDD
jgi:hypothetical protein